MALPVVKCPKCGGDVTIDIAHAVDELGEIHRCKNCGYELRYVDKVTDLARSKHLSSSVEIK